MINVCKIEGWNEQSVFIQASVQISGTNVKSDSKNCASKGSNTHLTQLGCLMIYTYLLPLTHLPHEAIFFFQRMGGFRLILGAENFPKGLVYFSSKCIHII